MANDNLRAALHDAGLRADDLAEIVEVDVRTVRRWLSGRIPYPRQRGKVLRALDTTEHNLWPELVTTSRASQPTDLLAAYTAASDLDAPDWKPLMRNATDEIELLGDTLTPILGTPGVPELLTTKAAHGCHIRILLAYPAAHLGRLLEQPGIEIRVLEAPPHHTIYRFGEQLLLSLHTLDPDPEQAPLLHLRRAAPGGLFDRFAEHYNDLWEQDSQPINPDVDLPPDEDDHQDENPEPDPDLPAENRLAGRSEAPTPPPRRWPRRPAEP